MNLKELKEMVELMKDGGLTELEVEKSGVKVRLKKSSGGYEVTRSGSHETRVIHAEPETRAAQPAKPAAEPENVTIVRSPMVGTFYSAPAPDKDPYASVGTTIKVGDVLCIVEAMKLMNEIKAEVSGKVIEVLIANGQPIEFDQPLFKIQKT